MDEPSGPVLATVIPVYNEASHVATCLNSLINQTLAPEQHMIMVLDGGSTDDTRSIVQSIMATASTDGGPPMVLLDNPGRTVAHARNLALEHLPPTVQFLIEMIGHAVVESSHLEQRLEAWSACERLAGDALAGVGARVVPLNLGRGGVTMWIEGVLASPLGQSGGQFAKFTKPEPTSVPAFVMHKRQAVEAVGGWDEAFITSQDSDLSMRLQKAGHVLYRHPSPTVAMHKRSSLRQWWKMGHRYGFWRTKVLLKHPTRATWQEFLPLLGLVMTAVLSLQAPQFGLWLPFLYFVALALAGVHQALKQRALSCLWGVPLCLVMLHTSFTVGLADGVVRQGRLPSDRA
jgi:succinoglycan biosynthesis protein ExoA